MCRVYHNVFFFINLQSRHILLLSPLHMQNTNTSNQSPHVFVSFSFIFNISLRTNLKNLTNFSVAHETIMLNNLVKKRHRRYKTHHDH